MSDTLKKILKAKAEEVSARAHRKSLVELKSASASAPPTRGFVAAINQHLQARRPAVIAEIKKASPSKGVIRQDFDAVQIAKSYQNFGATCLSVLTDERYFQGSDSHLIAAKDACTLPILRKDFTIDPYQIYEARVLGADAILLIVAALGDTMLAELNGLAHSLEMDVLVEAHNAAELERAMSLPGQLIGINNRNLRTFETRLDTTLNLLPKVATDKIIVTESGINTRQDVTTMRQHNVHTFLVGEACMRAPCPGAKLAELFDIK